MRAVQNARKEAGLEITDRIELGLAGDAELVEVGREHEAYIAGETLAKDFILGEDSPIWAGKGDGAGDGDGAGSAASVTTIDDRELRISVRRV